ncbi:MAG: hypothetical protein DMF81_13170, partial [Acidobacteria bacterium]
ALAARGARFEQAQTPVPMTGPSHATILTGLYPPVHGVRDNIVFSLDPRHKTLATWLKAQGYRTAAFVGAYPVAAAFGFRQGFDTFTENFRESPIPGAGAQRPANEVIDDALGWLANPGRRPFFVWVHLYDPHAPYDPPEPYAGSTTARSPSPTRSSGASSTGFALPVARPIRWSPCSPTTASRWESTAR